MKVYSLLASAATAASINRCRQQPDGTMLPDLTDPTSYVTCEDGQEVSTQCPDGLYWDQHFQECQQQKACPAPNNWQNHGMDYVYADGIYYGTYLDTTTQANTGIINSRWLCAIYGGKASMPYTDAEYDQVKAAQTVAVRNHLQSDACVNAEDPTLCDPVNGGTEYEFFMGIENILRDEQAPSLDGILYAHYYYVDSTRTGNGYDYRDYGAPFTQDSWWMPGYPNNLKPKRPNDPNWDDFMAKHVIQVGDSGLMNIMGDYRVDGVNCMYVCPGYN